MTARQPRPDNCVGCEKSFRPNRAQVAQYPGTVMHAGRGLCHECRRLRRVGSHCRGCERPFRPGHARATEYPGTVQHHAHGHCATCSSRMQRGIDPEPIGLPAPKIQECACGQLTRPRRMSVEDALKLDPRPTITRIGSVCYRCSEKRPPVTPERIEYITRELMAYMRWRGRDVSQLGISA